MHTFTYSSHQLSVHRRYFKLARQTVYIIDLHTMICTHTYVRRRVLWVPSPTWTQIQSSISNFQTASYVSKAHTCTQNRNSFPSTRELSQHTADLWLIFLHALIYTCIKYSYTSASFSHLMTGIHVGMYACKAKMYPYPRSDFFMYGCMYFHACVCMYLRNENQEA